MTQDRGWTLDERVSATVRPLVGLGLVLVIYGVVRRNPWPRPFRLRFALMHIAISAVLSASWIVISRLIEALVLGWGQTVPYEREFFLIGSVAYVIVAGISYAVESTARAARAEAVAASTQLAALRSQLHPHFLFNALHTVVQLIPVNPTLAMEAAELVAELLRASLEEQRDEVPLSDEWRFVSRYLAVERIRFGDRLVVHETLPSELLHTPIPAFALQTLVENAVRHGAAPRVAPTTISISARHRGSVFVLTVRNDGDEAAKPGHAGIGTGLTRLRERLAVLYGNAATLTAGPVEGGYEAVLTIPEGR
ncbi:sensor histidine kinase [Gemmatimonas sp.]|uniref:sensor histidine kinase n=1 Tax=Gemmatimonas sp. TaxID=1962908 RepID=UPI002EDA31EC